MKGIIKQKTIIATGTISLIFTLAEPLKFQAGQYFFISLKKPPFTDKKGNSRHFTIASAPETVGEIEMATRLSGSAFKRSLEALPIGSEVEISGPAGTFLLPSTEEVVMIAGGIGITPFISQLRHIKKEKSAYKAHKIVLLYFNKNSASTAFLEELRELEKTLPDFRLAPIMSEDENWPGERGIISAEIIKKYSQSLSDPVFMVVGPPPMTAATIKELGLLQIKKNRILVENFTGYDD